MYKQICWISVQFKREIITLSSGVDHLTWMLQCCPFSCYCVSQVCYWSLTSRFISSIKELPSNACLLVNRFIRRRQEVKGWISWQWQTLQQTKSPVLTVKCACLFSCHRWSKQWQQLGRQRNCKSLSQTWRSSSLWQKVLLSFLHWLTEFCLPTLWHQCSELR